MSQSRVIAFTGTVGSGKSTHMKLLSSKLKQKGLKTRMSFLSPYRKFRQITNKLVVLLAGEGGERFPRTKISSSLGFIGRLSG